jgi:hypothetical protein
MRKPLLGTIVLALCWGCGWPGAPVAPTAVTPALPSSVSLNVVTVGIRGSAPAGIACPLWAVLTNPEGTYTAADLQQLGAYLSNLRLAAHAFYDSDPGTSPPTVQAVHAGVAQPDAHVHSWNAPWCTFALQVTNIGRSTLQIPEVGLRLTGPSAPNRDRYPLVDACSVLGVNHYCGPQFGAGAGPCDVYHADVALGDGTPGAAFSGPAQAFDQNLNPCPEVTLAPNASVELVVQARSAQARDFPAEPFLKITSAAGDVIYPVPAIAGHVRFADPSQFPSQFSCYRLSGGSFTLAVSGAEAMSGAAELGAWCA